MGPAARALLDTGQGAGEVERPVRPGPEDRPDPQQPVRLPLRHGRDRPAVRLSEPGRVLRAVQARVLPPLRVDDGDPAARREPGQPASRPGSSRASCPATASATSRRSGTARRTRGSRSTSRPSAGSGSTRPARASGARARSRPGTGRATVHDPSGPAERTWSATRSAACRTRRAGATPVGRGGAGGDRLIFALLTVLLVVVLGGVALAAWIRGPRGEVTPDRAWQSMSKAALAAGLRPACRTRPSTSTRAASRSSSPWRPPT